MTTGRSIQTIETPDFKGGCNYNKDISALEANETPNAMNMI